jgi:dTMP kinase
LLSVLERVAVNGVRPDLTVILDLPAEEGLKRAGARRAGTDPDAVPDRFEKETIEAHETIRAAFRRIAEAEPDRCVIVDATGDEDAVAEAVWAALAERLLPEASS